MIELFAAFCYLTISFNGEAILNLKNIVKSRRALCGGWQIDFLVYGTRRCLLLPLEALSNSLRRVSIAFRYSRLLAAGIFKIEALCPEQTRHIQMEL